MMLGKLIFILFVSRVFVVTGFAQGSDEIADDPLRNKHIWAKLLVYPLDEILWQQYFGKDLFDLTAQEYEMMEHLKGRIQTRERKAQEAIQVNRDNRKKEYAKKYKNTVLSQEYYDLITNIQENFELIEAFFAKEFTKYQLDYLRYDELHPDKKYNLIKWVDEQEARLISVIKH